MTERDPDTAYANQPFIPDGAAYPARWAEAAAAFRAEHPPEVLGYGSGEREVCDLFLPEAPPRGTVVFVHGGYWMAFDRRDWSHLAAGPLAHGWAVAMPSYPLAPGARIAGIGQAVGRAIRGLADRMAGPLVLTGHSAGGHLVARLAGMTPRLRRVVPISPLSDLAPLRQTRMNETLRIDAAEAQEESPVHLPPPPCPVHVWVGGDERPAFLDQARWLGAAWDCPVTVEPGRHHFDVIDGIAEPDHPLCRLLCA